MLGKVFEFLKWSLETFLSPWKHSLVCGKSLKNLRRRFLNSLKGAWVSGDVPEHQKRLEKFLKKGLEVLKKNPGS